MDEGKRWSEAAGGAGEHLLPVPLPRLCPFLFAVASLAPCATPRGLGSNSSSGREKKNPFQLFADDLTLVFRVCFASLLLSLFLWFCVSFLWLSLYSAALPRSTGRRAARGSAGLLLLLPGRGLCSAVRSGGRPPTWPDLRSCSSAAFPPRLPRQTPPTWMPDCRMHLRAPRSPPARRVVPLARHVPGAGKAGLFCVLSRSFGFWPRRRQGSALLDAAVRK